MPVWVGNTVLDTYCVMTKKGEIQLVLDLAYVLKTFCAASG